MLLYVTSKIVSFWKTILIFQSLLNSYFWWWPDQVTRVFASCVDSFCCWYPTEFHHNTPATHSSDCLLNLSTPLWGGRVWSSDWDSGQRKHGLKGSGTAPPLCCAVGGDSVTPGQWGQRALLLFEISTTYPVRKKIISPLFLALECPFLKSGSTKITNIAWYWLCAGLHCGTLSTF